MKKYYTGFSFFGESLSHSANRKHAERGTANSTTEEKGTDGKQNNSSEYNHKYYESNKEKWQDVSKHDYDPEGDDEDFKKVYGNDLKNPKLNMDTHIKGTDFYQVTNSKGQIVLINGNKKWVLPEGVKLTGGMIQQLSKIDSNGGKQGEAFDKAMKKFMDDNRYNVKESKKKKKSSKKSSESNSSGASETKDTNKNRTIEEAADEQLEKKKNIKHADDFGSILIRDLF